VRLRDGWFLLAAIVVGAIVIRVALVWWANRSGFDWIDPDHYLGQGRLFAAGDFVESFRYRDGFFKAPLHTVFLGLCARFPGSYPLNAIYAQAVVGGLSVLPLFALARYVSSERIALAAAGAYAVYFPAVAALIAVRQEHIYLPLLIVAFAALARAIETGGRTTDMAAAGAAFGLAALTRSMPVVVVPVAAVLLAGWPGHSWRRAGAGLFGGFVLVVAPFVIWISIQTGHVMLVENIGSYGLAMLSADGRAYFGGTTPTLGSTAAFVWGRIAAAPVAYVRDAMVILTAMFQVPGGRWLVELRFLPDLSAGAAMKAAAHAAGDAVFIVAITLAPLGVIARRAVPVVRLLGLWIVLHFVLTLLSGYGGQRFREPVDFALITLASAGLAGSWRPLTVARGLVAALAFLPMAVGAFPSIPTSLRTRPPLDPAATTSTDDEAGRLANGRLNEP